VEAPMNADPKPMPADKDGVCGTSVPARVLSPLQSNSSAAIGVGSAFIGASKAFSPSEPPEK
jgi:hypothetical protein